VNWFSSLPSADAVLPCGNGSHTIRWEDGRLSLLAHPDPEAELVLAALGGDKPACVTLSQTWSRHAADLTVLMVGPRSLADRVTVTWEQVEEQRTHWQGAGSFGGMWVAASGTGSASSFAVTRPSASGAPRPPSSGAAQPPAPGAPPAPGPPRPNPVRRIARARAIAMAGRGPLGSGGMRPGGPGVDDLLQQALQRLEVLELLALGPAFQFRLSGAVAAAWASPARSADREKHRPALTAALTGRFAPAAAAWLGVDPDAVTVTPYEGPGWGTLSVSGAGGPDAGAASGAGQGPRVSLPVSWLSEVWACGLAVVDGHLVVAVERPGYPRARVLALPAPGADPVVLDVEATDTGPERPGEAGAEPREGTADAEARPWEAGAEPREGAADAGARPWEGVRWRRCRP